MNGIEHFFRSKYLAIRRYSYISFLNWGKYLPKAGNSDSRMVKNSNACRSRRIPFKCQLFYKNLFKFSKILLNNMNGGFNHVHS